MNPNMPASTIHQSESNDISLSTLGLLPRFHLRLLIQAATWDRLTKKISCHKDLHLALFDQPNFVVRLF